MTISGQSFGERLRLLRLACDFSQTDLAERINVNGNGLISKLENGRAVLDDAQMSTLARKLDCSTDYLRRPAPDLIATKPWLRAYSDAPARVVDAVTADNILQYEFSMDVGLRRIPNRIPLFDGDLNDADAIERFAEEVRDAAEIDEGGVVGNAMRAVERLGCIVLPLRDELGRHLGLSQYVDGTPYIRVSRPSTASQHMVPGDRQRFTVLHELGHLSLHASEPPPETADAARRIENQAHRFAAAFLAPSGPLCEDLDSLGGRVTLKTLVQLKSNWGIAIKALVVRFQHLGVIDASHATSLYKQISKHGWNTSEPVQVSNEKPIWFERALAGRAGESKSVGIPSLDLRSSHIKRWLAWDAESQMDAKIVSLDTHRSRSHSRES